MKRTKPHLLVFCLLISCNAATAACAQDGSRLAAEHLLDTMNTTLVAEVIEVCDLAVKLHGEYQKLSEEFESLRTRLQADKFDAESLDAVRTDLERTTAALRQLVELVDRLTTTLVNRSDGFRQLAGIGDRVRQLQTEIRRSGKAAEKMVQDAQQRLESLLAELAEEAQNTKEELLQQLRSEFRDLRAAISDVAALVKRLESEAFDQIQSLRDPAQYFRGFAEGKLREWISQPINAPGSDVTFRIEQVNPTQPLFGKDAALAIILHYQEGIELKASGVYFVYKEGGIPEPRFDRVRVDESALAALGQQALSGLGDAIPDSLGLPITIKSPRFHGFDEGKMAGGLSFDIEVGGFLEFADQLKLSAKGVTILTNGQVTLSEGLKSDIPGQVPIGTTPLIFDGGWIELNPNNPQEAVSVGTHIAVAAAGKQTLSLDVTLTFGLPTPEVSIEGSLTIGQSVTVGTIKGGMNAQRVWGELRIPSQWSPIPGEILTASFNFELNEEGLTADGLASLFGLIETHFDLAVRLDGTGHLHATKSFSLGIGRVDGTFHGEFHDNFSRITIEATARVRLNLGFWRVSAAIVEIRGSNDEIRVTAKAAGLSASFTVSGLNDITVGRLERELRGKAQQGLFDVGEAITGAVEQGFKAFPKLEKEVSRELASFARRMGIDRMRTGIGWLDRGAGDLSKAAQDLYSGKTLKDVGKTLGSVFGRGRSRSRDRPSAEEQMRQRLTDEFRQKLQELVAGCGAIDESFAPPPDITSQAGFSHRRQQAAGFACETATAAGKGDGGGTLGTVMLVSGFASSINSRSADVTRKSESAVLTSRVEFQNLVGDKAASATARIDIDPWEDPSGMDTPTMIRHRLQSLIELYLPEVEIEGRKEHVVKQLAIRNPGEESIIVWVQANCRRVQQRQFVWQWIPESPGGTEAYRFTVPARTEHPHVLRYEDSDDPRGQTGPVLASRVRLWIESESGYAWDEYRREDLWLVEENPQLGGRRSYDAEDVATYVHTVVPSNTPRLFTERMLVLRNDTAESLHVDLRYYTTRLGSEGWQTLSGIQLAPGATLRPVDQEGLGVRASRIVFTAKGENLVFTKHRGQPLWLVKPAGSGHRAYRGRQIGRFVHVFAVEGKGTPGNGKQVAQR